VISANIYEAKTQLSRRVAAEVLSPDIHNAPFDQMLISGALKKTVSHSDPGYRDSKTSLDFGDLTVESPPRSEADIGFIYAWLVAHPVLGSDPIQTTGCTTAPPWS
jgi:hypothetical protein